MQNKNIKAFFYPKSVCVAGASSKEKSIGYEILKTIKSYNFTGKVFPVNPKSQNILGYNCFASIEQITDQIDLAIIVVPKKFVMETVDQLLSKSVKSIVLITAGFRETGEEGKLFEEDVLKKIKSANASMIGPNCMGVISSIENIKLNATFVAEEPQIGKTAFLSQSGALGAAVLNSLRETNIRFAHFVSVGNKADLNENDFLLYWQNDKNIETVTMYLESFEDGEGLIKSIAKGEVTKPLIILKAGRTNAGQKAAESHTGALGSQDRVVESIMDQFGIIRADNLNDLFNTAKGFENFPVPNGNRIAVVTNAGGPAILAVDALEKEGLALAELNETTKLKLKEIVHPEGSVNNPVDLLPGGDAASYKSVNEILLQDEEVDAVISIFVEPVMVSPIEVVESVNNIKSTKPVFQVVMPLPEFWQNFKAEKPLFKNPEDPGKVISNMLFYKNHSNELLSFKFGKTEEPLVAVKAKEEFLSPEESKTILEKYNLPLVPEVFINVDETINLNDSIFPCVLKAVGNELIHKSELNAVRLDIRDNDELIAEMNSLKAALSSLGIGIEKFQVQKFVKTKHELLIGGFRDPSFGPMIMFGSGGKYVEVFNDTEIRSAYISKNEILRMINKTNIGKILNGVRGEKPIDMDLLLDIIYSCTKMMVENPEISEFDINPIILNMKDEFYIVDYRIKT